jgi:hypothetical protein
MGMSKRKKSVKRKRTTGRRRDAEKALKDVQRLSRKAIERANVPWEQDPFSDNAMHQVKLMDATDMHLGVRIHRWRGEYNGEKRRSGFMVVGAGENDGTDKRVLYRGPDQERAWQIYRAEKNRVQGIVDRFLKEVDEVAVLGNDPELKTKLRSLIAKGAWAQAGSDLEAYAESFGDESIMPSVRESRKEMWSIDPYPWGEDYYEEERAWERFDESGGTDDVYHGG